MVLVFSVAGGPLLRTSTPAVARRTSISVRTHTVVKPEAAHTRRTLATWRTLASGSSPPSLQDGSDEPPLPGSSEKAVLLWFKHDLRLDDHPGLIAAVSSGRSVIPCFVLDATRYTHFGLIPSGLECLVDSVDALRGKLRSMGSDLIIREGSWEEEVPALAAAFDADVVVTEQEVEARWLEQVEAVTHRLAAADTAMHAWSIAIFQNYPDNFRDFRATRGRRRQPLPPPEHLGPGFVLPEGATLGALPSVAGVREAVTAAYDSRPGAAWSFSEAAASSAATRQEPWRAPLARMVAGGEAAASDALAGYLRYLEGNNSRSWDDLNAVVREVERPGCEGGSFPTIFGLAMQLGLLSRRRVHGDAIEYEVQRNGGRLPLVGGVTATAARDTTEGSDFHYHLAKASIDVCGPSGLRLFAWRWRGVLTDYIVARAGGAEAPDSGSRPAILLVHGFGAFGDHWRGNTAALAARGYDVYSPTLPGFGRSEKAPGEYSQQTWADFLRDFVLQVVRKPVVLAGNSIGGFISASMAADHRELVEGLILINSAGKIEPDFSIEDHEEALRRQKFAPPFVATIASKALFLFLENSIGKTLLRLYPSAPNRVDEWLESEIFRAACDPGSLAVFRNAFFLPAPRALDYLVSQCFQKPTLVLQGVLDPLNDARGRAESMRACSNVEVELLQAGHCPMDELPEECNEAIIRFVEAMPVAERPR